MLKIILLVYSISFSTLAIPEWVTSPQSFCPPTELCSVGESSGSMSADAAARESLAKIFSTRVSSKKTVLTSSESNIVNDVVSGEVSEDTYHEIKVSTDELIEGAYIKKRFETDEGYFSLAAIHKRKSSMILEDRMTAIDKEVISLIKDGRRSSLNKALKKKKVRLSIHEKYRILRDTNFSSKVSIEDILSLKRAKRDLGVKVSVKVDELSPSKEILKSIKVNLVENDFIIAKSSADYRIEVKLSELQQYMKVKGFVKFKFILEARSYNKSGSEIGTLKYEIIQTGRNKNQSYENALPGIQNFIEEKFNELNID